LQLQTKLLRVLQERRFRRVGGLADVVVDVRVVAATNRDLRQEVAGGRFRQDLYFRLRVVPIQVPALRERAEDILPLGDHLLKRLGPELGRPELKFSAAARTAMSAYAWPGNVRELANAVERAVITAETNEIAPGDLCMDEQIFTPPTPQSFAVAAPAPTAATPTPVEALALPKGTLVIPAGERNLARIEAMLVRAALDETGGQKSRAAELLGINRTTLYNKLRELDPAAHVHDEVVAESV
ncbi:MAG TPA: sigma 54-interacting transcriptional regulator, partial [Planctomycetota bacterium]|nr:sigma 54-interacting transcriptional regulator [Planctomycetota bacterium]